MEKGTQINNIVEKFGTLFLSSSTALQKIKTWTNKKDWDELLKNTFKELNIIYGYFVEYDPHENVVKYFFGDNEYQESNLDLPPLKIPYLIDNSEGYFENKILLQKLRASSQTKFINSIESPKVFQHLPVQPKADFVRNFDTLEVIPNTCLNCHIPCEIRSNNDYYVILFDEIAFFQYAYSYLSGNTPQNVNIIRTYNKEFLTYLLKFAIGLEQKLKKDELARFLELENEISKWNKLDENDVRNLITKRVYSEFDKINWQNDINSLLKNLTNYFIGDVKSLNVFGDKDIDILKVVARFDIAASFEIKGINNKLIYHDVFVFPIYTQKKEKVFDIKCVNGNVIDIHSPILVVLYIKTLNEIVKGKWDEDLESIKGFQLTKEIVKLFTERLIQEEYLRNVIKKELAIPATRAAISQVMARNTSHNLGAHVMNKLTGSLRELSILNFNNENDNYWSKIDLKKDISKYTIDKLSTNEWFKNSIDDKFKGEALKNEILLDQISLFNNYVKCRMDYLADISFGTPLMQTNKYVYGELFKDLDKVRLLLEYISGLSNNFRFEIQFRYNGEEMSDDKDLLVAIPNDILGLQAFYNILENIIRNTAKHAKDKPDDKTIFTIHFIDDIQYVDNNIKAQNEHEIQDILSDFIVVEVYDNIPVEGNGEIHRLVTAQNTRINADILEGNKLRSGSLGIIEMDASAAYLRKCDVNYINHDRYSLLYDDSWGRVSVGNSSKSGINYRYFLKAFKKEGVNALVKKEEKCGSALGYRLFLLRPEIVLIVTNLDIGNENLKELKKQGVWVVSLFDFKLHLNSGKVYNHEFVLYVREEQVANEMKEVIDIVKLICDYKTALPLRVLEINNQDLRNEDTEEDHSGLFDKMTYKVNMKEWLSVFEEFCWGRWEEKLKSKFNFSEYSNAFYPKVNGQLARISNHLYSFDTQKSKRGIWNELKKNAYFVEPASSKSQFYLPGLKNKELNTYPEVLKRQLPFKIQVGEAILTKIVVIDERIQQESEQEPMGIPQQEVYRMMNIFVPLRSDINLTQSTLDKVEIEAYIEKMLFSCDFLLLHYSVLERIFNIEVDRVKAINNFLIKLSSKINVVVTSGRGIPNKLPSEVRFINLSSVIMAFNEVRGKYLINYLLNTSRKTNSV